MPVWKNRSVSPSIWPSWVRWNKVSLVHVEIRITEFYLQGREKPSHTQAGFQHVHLLPKNKHNPCLSLISRLQVVSNHCETLKKKKKITARIFFSHSAQTVSLSYKGTTQGKRNGYCLNIIKHTSVGRQLQNNQLGTSSWWQRSPAV